MLGEDPLEPVEVKWLSRADRRDVAADMVGAGQETDGVSGGSTGIVM